MFLSIARGGAGYSDSRCNHLEMVVDMPSNQLMKKLITQIRRCGGYALYVGVFGTTNEFLQYLADS
jgi:hypothetical protein